MAACVGLLALVLAGCGGGGSSGSPDALDDLGDAAGYTVDTQLSLATVEVGQSVTVTCSVTGPTGAFETATTIAVTPADGWTLDGTTVTFTKTGDFEVACQAPEIPATDETPATVTVTEGRPT